MAKNSEFIEEKILPDISLSFVFNYDSLIYSYTIEIAIEVVNKLD